MKSKELHIINDYTKSSSAQYNNFSEFIKQRQRAFEYDPIKTRQLASLFNIDYEYFRKIINRSKPTQKRDLIIAICAVLKMDIDQTNIGLELYYMEPLNCDNRRDDEIMSLLEEYSVEDSPALTIETINNTLSDAGYPELDLVSHREKKLGASFFPFKLLSKIQIQTYADEIIYGDPYGSLKTEYRPQKYRCNAKCILEDKETGSRCLLCASTTGNYTLRSKNKDGKESFHSFSALNESGRFKPAFSLLKQESHKELKSLLEVLHDTKNYGVRVSANIKNDKFHAFAETFNYQMPEFSEYYLVEHLGSTTLFYVFSSSEFMRHYLSHDDYRKTYNNQPAITIAKYSSLEEVDEIIKISSFTEKQKLTVRKRYFVSLQNELKKMTDEIKEGKCFVRNLDYYDTKDSVCKFFSVESEYNCVTDSFDSSIIVAQKKSADFNYYDVGPITITLPELHRAFELGFNDIHEICRVKAKLGSIERILG